MKPGLPYLAASMLLGVCGVWAMENSFFVIAVILLEVAGAGALYAGMLDSGHK